jgi:microcystin-dependent protein
MTFFKWSKTAASNGTADSTCPFPEGMAPSALNDGTRGMMAAAAKFRDDTSGALVTGGTSTAYTLTSNQVFTSKALMDGAEIALTVHATNGASPTLNVDGLGADPIIIDTVSSATPVPTATLLTGGVYTLVYYNTGNTWRLKDFYQLPFTVPIGGMVDYFGTTAPNSNFVFPYGQAISRTTYSALFALVGTTHGTGDGSTTFNVPDLRGRVIAGKDDMGGSAASRLTSTYYGTSAAALGAVGGGQSHAIAAGEVPSLTSSGSNSISVLSTVSGVPSGIDNGSWLAYNGTSSGSYSPGKSGSGGTIPFGQITSTGNNSISVSYTNGAQTQLGLVQPTIIANKLLRII